MRKAQATYFRERTPAALGDSKRLEKAVDEATTAILSGKAQPSLFEGDTDA
jgi:hypothetical protein